MGVGSIVGSLIERKKKIMMMQNSVLDTSPIIEQYGYSLDASNEGTKIATEWCYTIWYNFEPELYGNAKHIVDNQTTNRNNTYQFQNIDGSKKDWWYGPRQGIGWLGATLGRIRFSIKIAEIDSAFAYCEENGQIFFAGKNTIYYGHKNISELN